MLLHFKILFQWHYEMLHIWEHLQNSYILKLKLLFCLQINTKVFYKVLVLVWMCVNSLVQSTHNNKFAISLQILSQGKKKISIWVWQRKPKLPKIKSLLLHISMKVSCKLVLCFWMGMVKHSPKQQVFNVFTIS